MLKKISPENSSRFCALVVGQAGVGKTSLLRTLLGQRYDTESRQWEQNDDAEGTQEKVCVLSAESGLLCVRDLVTAGRIEGFEIGSFQDLRDAYTVLQSQECKQRYQWVFLDSLTEISARCVETVKAKYPSKGDSYPMWGEYNDSMTQIIKAFRDFPAYNVVFTCLVTSDKDANGVRYRAPMISGSSLKERLTSYFDEVLYMERLADENGIQHAVFMSAEPAGVAKDRSGKLAAVEPANLLTIKTKILS